MKNVGVPETPLGSADSTSSAILPGALALAQVLREPLDVESELRRVADEVRARERVLVVEQRSCISQNLPCAAAASARLGGELGVRVDVVQRQVAPHVPERRRSRRAARG